MRGTVRLCTLNLWGRTEPLERRLRMAAEELGKLDLDVVALQEVAGVGEAEDETTATRIAGELGMEVVAEARTANDRGLALLSRQRARQEQWTTVAGEGDDAVSLLSAEIVVGAATVWIHTTHLSWRLADGLRREQEVVAIDSAIRELSAGEVHLLCGDFNATPDSDEMRFLRGLTSLGGVRTHYQDAWIRRHGDDPGVTWCAEVGPARARRSVDIDRRLDYIYVSSRQKDGRGTVLDCRVVVDRRDPATDTPVSDHYGLFSEVQIAEIASVASA